MTARDHLLDRDDPEWNKTVDEILAEHRTEVLAEAAVTADRLIADLAAGRVGALDPTAAFWQADGARVLKGQLTGATRAQVGMNTHPGESTQAVPLCDVEFVDGRRCSKTAGHWTPESQDLHVPAEPAPPADSHQATCGEPRPTDHVQASADKPRGPLSGGGK